MQTKPDEGDDYASRIKRYKEEIAYYEKESQAWSERVRKILRRYKDERSPRQEKSARFNILYSNIQTLMPAVYGRNPKPDIERRFKDDDVIGRVTSEILERCCSFFVDKEKFRSAMRSALFDRLTGGRGVVWTRYVPHFKDMELQDDEIADQGPEITQDVEEATASDDDGQALQEVSFEEVDTDYVHWADFGHNWARTYDEVYLGWRKVYLSRPELIKRFGEAGASVPLDYFPKGLADQKKDVAIKKAVIYEIWDDIEKKVCWIHKDVEDALDGKDDPLKLDGFFPFPKPLFGVVANDTLIPVPDYIEYQDQAQELDQITSRIASITKSIKVAGIYDASAPGIERLLAEGTENKLIAVEQWAIIGEKGGLKGAMDLLPMDAIAQTLLTLYEARDKVKQDLYEITGLSDIIRGATKVETATAQEIKAKFATLRLSDLQEDMARFARDAVRNICVVIAEHFSIDTIKQISGIKLLTAQEKQQIQMQQQQAQQQYQQAMQQFQSHQQAVQPQGGQIPPQSGMNGQNPPMPNQPQAAQPQQMKPPPPPPPLSDDMQELLENPSWEDVGQLLKNKAALSFKIDIETDSTIRMDEDAERDARVEFLKATAEFISKSQEAAQQNPQLAPLFGHMLMFGIRGFKVGKELEGQFRVAVEKLEKEAANPQPKPDIEQQKLQADIAQKKAELDMKMQEMQQEAQVQAANDQRDAQREDQRAQMDYQLKMKEMEQEHAFRMEEMQQDANLDVKKHEMTVAASAKPAVVLGHNMDMDAIGKHVGAMVEGINNGHKAIIEGHNALLNTANNLARTTKEISEHAKKPKVVSMMGHNGRMLQAKVE